MFKIVGCLVLLVALAGGCLTRHNIVVTQNQAACQAYGVDDQEYTAAIARAKGTVKTVGDTVVKVLPDGRIVRVRDVASIRMVER